METEGILEKRERKQTTFFKAPVAKESSKIVITDEGSGIKLADNPHFCKELELIKGDNEVCKALHLLLFNARGKRLEIKKNLRAFSGFPSAAVKEEKMEKVMDKKKVWNTTTLRTVVGMFGLEKGGDRDALVTRMMDYIAKPSFTKDAKASSKKRRSVSKSKKTNKKTRKTSPSGYMLYCQDTRQSVRDENPDLSMIEQTKILGANWNALSETEKEPYLERARNAKLALAASETGDAGADIDFGSDDEEGDDTGSEKNEEDEGKGAASDDGAEDDFKALEESDNEE